MNKFEIYIITKFNRIKNDYKSFVFSGGEVQVKLYYNSSLDVRNIEKIIITGNIKNSNDIMELLLLTDAIKREYLTDKIHLEIPYLPYSRQDRVCAAGESLSLKVFADIVNSQNYKSVTTWDVHSTVSLALINNIVEVPQEIFVGGLFNRNYFYNSDLNIDNIVLVSPDAGALKKIYKTQQILKENNNISVPVVEASKIRNVENGEIIDTTVNCEHIENKDFLIVDDLVDGGMTFIKLSKKLKEKTNGKIFLYVTHGIFSKGIEVFKNKIDNIFCPNILMENWKENNSDNILIKL